MAFSNNTTNTGNIVDINAANSGCLDIVEFQGTWYVFSPSASGDLGLTIAPLGPDDYDWAIWGPYPPGSTPNGICPPAGPPIRCAASSGPATFNSTGSYATGMGDPTYSPPQFASTAISYGLPATLNICPLVLPQYCGWVPGMQVTVGEVYLLYISNWSQSSIGFELDWNLQNGASLDCTVLPVELLSLQAYAVTGGVNVDWTTATEIDNDRFEIERALDGEHFEHIGTMPGAGNSLQTLYYTFLDPHPHHGINYYRLRQVDHNGDHAYSPVRTVQFSSTVGEVRMVPNPGSSFVDVLWPQVEPGSLLVMHDATGREVSRVHLEAPRTTIDVSSLSRGVYGSHVQLPSGEHSSPVVWVRE
ncbi:MAG: T9SS type A sorting domain-containing protein [Flavobacteriales bacterium]|nr:T9SS type A sorting domain-containing protein [Flavobacteriales bacterium]